MVADTRDSFGRTPLDQAAQGGHEAVVKLLLSRDDVVADTRDYTGRTPLDKAVEGGHEAIRRLIEQKLEDVSYTAYNEILDAMHG